MYTERASLKDSEATRDTEHTGTTVRVHTIPGMAQTTNRARLPLSQGPKGWGNWDEALAGGRELLQQY